jgi:UDP-glucose:(heptosyl)LPS alpha-1,3-glucosyltransferase
MRRNEKRADKMSDVRKIAVVIPKYGLVGGAEGYAAELTERLALNPGYDIHVFANQWDARSDRITFHKVPIISFPKFLTMLSFAFFVDRLVSKQPFDLIHSHDRIFHADIYTMHGIPHKNWVTHVRKKKRMSLFDWSTAWVEKQMITNGGCQRFIAVSDLTKEIFLREYPVDPKRISVIHPGIHIRKTDKLDRERYRQSIRKQFGIGATDIIILFVSMNFDIKGLDAVIAGVARLKSRNLFEKFKLLVVGKGNEKYYRRLAHDLGIQDHVIFSGVVEKENLEHIYLASDVYVMLSKFDTFGLVVLEAMAASLPVVISGNVGAKDLIREGINGFVINDTDDPDMMAKKLGVMLDEDVRTRMAQAAFETASTYPWEKTAKEVEAVYEELLR